MKKLLVVLLLGVFLMPLAVSPVFAAEETVNVGNALCPVSGDPVSGSDFAVYQGKSYGLCCPACEKIFLNDPAKYIAKLKAGETAVSNAPVTADASASEQMKKDMEQGSL